MSFLKSNASRLVKIGHFVLSATPIPRYRKGREKPTSKKIKTKGKRFQLTSNFHQMDEPKEKDCLLAGIDLVGRDVSEEAVTETDDIEMEVAV
ncbi:hypothetical protein AVEN_179946-1 [Araneus ventricosus]|uniref:Uncharacterized protein n=1 Tax=Araneus ventricosus TaxID=182803 RepID=A0A4Y2TG89_ARAVE|nr:hypothetical protein AVEN_179946-1 [Araneus ventricosus]